MPRTKRTSKTTKKKVSDTLSIDKTTRKKEIDEYLKLFEFDSKHMLQNIDDECENVLEELKLIAHRQCKSFLAPRIGNCIIEDLPKLLAETTHITISDTTSRSNILEITNSIRSARPKKNRRSVSVADDEGYLTAENSENSGGSRRSRSRARQTKTLRTTRSLSRTKTQELPLDAYKTPVGRAPKNNYGVVTPKVKPNTPQVILRRPIEGEMAISMQGSPLMVNTIVSREANVNIPLGDGRTISIQPQHGLRMSQLPDIDSSIRRQIEVLRDNLIKVCEQSVTKHKKK